MTDANRTTPLRRRRDRRRRRRPARGDRGPAGRQEDRDHLQVAVRQGAHGDGRGRRRRRDGQRELRDNWQVHFRDTMRGGKFLNNFRMAELHAKEAPERIWELETYGALFDRTQGRQDLAAQLRRPRVPAPRARRRPHRPGADPHPAAEDRLAAAGGQARVRRLRRPDPGVRRDHHHRAAARRRPGRRRVRLLPRVRRVRALRGAGGRAGHRRRRQVLQGHLELLGVHRRRPRAGAARRRDADQHGVPPVPPDRHGLAALGQGHPGHRVGPRRRRRPARTPRASGSCSTTSPTSSASSTRRPRRRRTAGTPTRTTTGARRSCCPATRWPARSTPRSRPAAAPRPAASSSTSPAAPPAEEIRKRLPSMYHQFKELADVDITKEPMEVGPTCHYVMGGVEVDPDSGAAVGHVQGLFAAGEVSGGMHGSNRLGGNSLSDLLVFGKRAGEHAATLRRRHRRSARRCRRPTVEAAVETALAPLQRGTGENPYTLQQDLQAVMGDLVGIIRRKGELEDALVRLAELRERVAKVGATGGRRYNPGWHLALDLRNMLVVSECTAKAALERRGVARRAHPRGLPGDGRRSGGTVNLVCSLDGDKVRLEHKPLPKMRPELIELFDRGELAKYLTDEELADFDALAGSDAEGGGQVMGSEASVPGLAGRRDRRRPAGLPGRGQRGRGRPRHHPPAAGHRGARPGLPVELQGRQVRLLLDGDQRHAAAGLHDPDVDVRRRRDRHGHAAAYLPGHPGPGHRRLVQLREGPGDAGVRAARGRRPGRVPDAAGRRRALAGVPQVHRVLPVPEHLPRGP